MAEARELPSPVDLSHHLSLATKRRVASQVKKFYKYFQIPGIVQLAGGLPDPSYFPFDTLEGSSAQPDRYKHSPSDKADSDKEPAPFNPTPVQVVVPKDSGTRNILKEIDVRTALQYGTAQGYSPLFQWLRNFTINHLHPNVPYKDGPEIIMSCGNTDGMSKVMEALNDVWVEGRDPVSEKGAILCEEFCFTLAKANATPRGMNIAPVTHDAEGMMADGPGGLEDVLANWDTSIGRRPHVLYTVTMGHNPTGGVQSRERRKAIYEICVKYDVIIIEDEPYWYLQYPDGECLPADEEQKGDRSSGFPFLDSLVQSYLSIDYQGRVVRLDTFSKTVAPGCRLGWITGQPALIERIERIAESTTQQPSGFVQSMIAELLMGRDGHVALESSSSSSSSSSLSSSLLFSRKSAKPAEKAEAKAWDVSGWVLWLEGLRNNYQRRMEIMCSVLTEGQYLVKSGRRPSLSALTLSDASIESNHDDENDNDDDWAVLERTQMYTFHRPRGGMFLWLEMLWASHPLARRVPGAKLAAALWILLTRKPYLVLVGPGATFAATDAIRDAKAWRFFRFCFAAVDDAAIERASRGFVKGAHAFWRIKDEKEIDDLLEDKDDIPSLMAGGAFEGAGADLLDMTGIGC